MFGAISAAEIDCNICLFYPDYVKCKGLLLLKLRDKLAD